MMTDARKKNVTPPGISPEQKPEEPPKNSEEEDSAEITSTATLLGIL